MLRAGGKSLTLSFGVQNIFCNKAKKRQKKPFNKREENLPFSFKSNFDFVRGSFQIHMKVE